MNRYRQIAAAITAALLLSTATGCAGNSGAAESPAAASDTQAQITAGTADTWDAASATAITLDGTAIAIDGDGATADGNTLGITAAGTYVLTGTLEGSVVVAADSSDTVQLVLNGVEITADKNAAIYCQKADRLIITLAEGSVNAVSDAANFTCADLAAEEPDAAVFSKNDLTINGTGTLHVRAAYNNGIGTKDDLVIDGGAYVVTAANHGIRGRDSVTVRDGAFTIQSGADGIQSNNDEDTEKGWITLLAGDYTIDAANDAVQAETALIVSGGSYSLVTGGGSETLPADTSGSYKGLNAGAAIDVSGGSFDIDSADDALHSNGSIAISGGAFLLASGDDAVHADGDLTITGGEIDITASYEGLEAMTMTIADGVVNLVASDDGINVAGGNDATAEGSRFGRDNFGDDSTRWLKITGGTVTVDAQGDGIDVNGSAEMTGGTVYVSGPTNQGNGALDYDGSFNLLGGVLIAADSGGMAQYPGSASAQPSLVLRYSAVQAAGTTVELVDGAGNALASYAPAKEFLLIIISAPGMQDGQTYTVNTNGAKTIDATLSGSITSISDTGEAITGMGGMGGFPGGRLDRPQGEMGTPPDGTDARPPNFSR